MLISHESTTCGCWADESVGMEQSMRELRLMAGAGWTLVLIGTVFAVAALSAGAASAGGTVQLKSRLGDACLDAPSWLGDIPVTINPCNGSDSQHWNLNGRQLESAAFPGKC